MTTPIEVPKVAHRFVEVDGVRLSYREAGPPNAPTMLLLHGFPTASHQFRRLIDVLGSRYRMIAPDYPGFGQSDAPESATVGGPFEYTFDRLAETIEGFCERLELDRFVMYVFDFGAPVGFRLATRHPDWIDGLVVQNGNAYEVGLSPMVREFISLRPGDEGAEARFRDLYTLPAIRDQYVGGAREPEAIPPDGWTLDAHFLEPAERQQIQVDLAFDYHTTSSSTRAGRVGCASIARRRSSSGAATTRSSSKLGRWPTKRTSRTPRCTSSTRGTSRSRTGCSRSRP